MTTLEEALAMVNKLPIEQREMLVEIVKNQLIENCRQEIAENAKQNIALSHQGKLKPQSIDSILDELHAEENSAQRPTLESVIG